jgi:hypothetical protein
MKKILIGPAAAVLGFFIGQSHEARACGGCFHEPSQSQSTVVTGHRKAFAVSPTRTVLWDEIKYSGSPADFAWVLPVGPGAHVEAANEAWFEALEAATAVEVDSPTLNCASQGSSGLDGCGSAASSSAADEVGLDYNAGTYTPPVSVLHEGTVGPYDTATVHSTDPGALAQWLSDHNYKVPDDIAPVIAAYVHDGADFIALRLRPAEGIQQMQPVRVVTPGASMDLPMRMVAAGTGAFVGVVLYVISEGRYEAKTYHEVKVDPSQIVWDWSAQSSTYSTLRATALASGNGANFMTTFALDGALGRPLVKGYAPVAFDPFQYSAYNSGATVNNIADLYFATASNDAGLHSNACAPIGDVLLRADTVVTADEGGTSDAGGQARFQGPLDASSASRFVCNQWDDLAAAVIGMHPSTVWVTRLEMNLPHAALATDLTLRPSDAQTPVSNYVVAGIHKNPPCVLASGTQAASMAGDWRDEIRFGGAGALGMMALAVRRRLQRRRQGRSAS